MKRALVVAAALVAAACSPPLLKLPTGTGAPVDATEVESAIEQATARCLRVRTLTAEIAVSGSVGGQRVRGRLLAGVAESSGSARLEAVAPFGAPIFIFAAMGDDATLLLPREDRVLEHGRPDAVLDAVAGIPLDAGELEALLTGCLTGSEPGDLQTSARAFGAAWLALRAPRGEEAYLQRDSPGGTWSLVATVRQSRVSMLRWRAQYADREDGVPHSIRLTSFDTSGRAGGDFDLRLALSQVEIDAPLGAEVFKVAVPSSATRMTLEDLRRSGVFGGR